MAKESFMFLVFKPLEPIDVLLLRLIFTGNIDGVFLLIERIDFMGHKVGNFFFIEFDGADGAVFFLEPEGVFFHVQGDDSDGDALELDCLLALFYIVFEGLGDGGGIFMGYGEGAAAGVAGPCDIQRKIVFVHILVEGLHGLQDFIIIISQAGEVVPAAQGVHDVQKAGAGFI